MNALRALALLGALSLGGCSTIYNLTERPQIYGGIRGDIVEMGRGGPCGGAILGFLDAPFSFALDTALLPFTILYELFSSDREVRKSSEPRSGPPRGEPPAPLP